MAGISISAIVGDNGVIVKARKASSETMKAQIQEELQLKIIDLQIEKEKTGEKITNNDIERALGALDGIEIDISGKNVEGEYKEHGYKVDDNYNVIVTDRLTGDRPIGRAEVVTKSDNLSEVQILVEASLVNGEIKTIEALNGAKLLERKNSGEYIFVVNDNLTYDFKIRGSNGRNTTVSCTVNNAIPTRDDLFIAIANIDSSGIKKVRVVGKTSTEADDDEVIYSLNVIRHTGNMVLDGTNEYNGSKLVGTTYSFGENSDVSDGTNYAKNTVVLKVEGDLTINSGITLTSVNSTFGGPKGLIIYCTGTLYNYGEISMENRGAYAETENVFLHKNSVGAFEFIPKIGGKYGEGQSSNVHGTKSALPGQAGKKRGTGGGTGGSVFVGSNRYGWGSAAGAYGSSYGGGAPGGYAIDWWNRWGGFTARKIIEYGSGPSEIVESQGTTSASLGRPKKWIIGGGLLICKADSILGSGKYVAKGVGYQQYDSFLGYWVCGVSAGGGSVNLFAKNNLEITVNQIDVLGGETKNSISRGGNGTGNAGIIGNDNIYSSKLELSY